LVALNEWLRDWKFGMVGGAQIPRKTKEVNTFDYVPYKSRDD
jgi:hypothetical protein